MAPEYRLIDGHIIAAMLLDETTGQRRESRLDLDYCLAQGTPGGDNAYLVAARAPKDLKHPNLAHYFSSPWKLSDAIKYSSSGYNIVSSELIGSTIHMRHEIWIMIFPNRVTHSEINLNDYIRCTKTGRLEWMHPPYAALLPQWLETVLDVGQAMSKTPGNSFQMAVDMAKDALTADLVPQADSLDKIWMKDTYVDNGQLIRHGT